MVSSINSIFWAVAAVVAPSVIGIGWNIYTVRSNRRFNAALRLELEAKVERMREEREYKRKVDRHERMLNFLKASGLFDRNRHTKSGGFDFDNDF